MRISMVAAAAFLLLGTGAAVVSAAVDTTGNNINLNGSDTLFEVTQDVLAACPGATGNGITYQGGGSTTAPTAMIANLQQIGPMSRTLKNTEYCNISIDTDGDGVRDLPIQTTSQDLMIGLDGLSVLVGAANACGNGVAVAGQSFTVTVNGDGVTPATNCPGCTAGTNTYPIASSLDVVRMLWGGMDHEATPQFNCASDARKSLVKQWSSLFNAGCTNCTGGLTHVWRRSDLSGTTDAFISLVGFGARGIGNFQTVPNASKKTNPFCNGSDANAALGAACGSGLPACPTGTACDTSGFCMPVSFGGSQDFVDLDPIRVPCATTDQVCQANGTLGLVLPILPPDNRVNIPTQADSYPTVSCSVGKFDLVSTGNVHDKCPAGPSFLGQCFQPYFQSGTGPHIYSCISRSNAHAFGTPAGTDGRVWNLQVKPQALVGAYNLDANGREMNASFYRMHTTTPATGSTTTCQQPDATQQIGCLVVADPCSIGFAGREADQQAGNDALALENVLPTDQNVLNLVTGGTPVYELARRLFVASLVGFGHLKGGEAALGTCFANNNISKAAITGRNFIALPSPGVKCFSYDDAPLPGCGDSPAVTGCSDLPAGYITNPY